MLDINYFKMKSLIIRFAVWTLLLPVSAAVAQEKDAFTFVFMTDIHIKNEPLVLKSFRKAADRVNELKPDFVLSGGDQVYDVMRGNAALGDSLFTLLKRETKRMNAPFYTTVGNHDLFGIYKESTTDSTHAYYKYRLYERYLGNTYYSFDHKGWHFVVLNSLDVKDQRYIGSFSVEQLEWLAGDLKQLKPGNPVVLMTHLPLVSVQNQIKLPKDGISTGPQLLNKDKLMMIISGYNVKAVLQGHTHFHEDILVNNKTRFITGGSIAGRPSWRGENNGPRAFLYFTVDKKGEMSYESVSYEK